MVFILSRGGFSEVFHKRVIFYVTYGGYMNTSLQVKMVLYVWAEEDMELFFFFKGLKIKNITTIIDWTHADKWKQM